MPKQSRFLPAPMAVEELRRILSYNRETGVLTWLVDRGCNAHRIKAGTVAGWPTEYGYVVIRINGKLYRAHRLAVYIETGEWPPEEVDHENRIKSDARWDNLRLATHGQNQTNREPSAGRPNTSGFRGVSANGTGWKAQISAEGVLTYLGTFATKEEAHTAYCEAARRLHGEFARID